jgi:hypothetical protein
MYNNKNEFEKYMNTGDGGIDITGYHKKIRVSLQCKYKTNEKVSPKEIREFIGALNHDKDTIGIFVTNNGYSFKSVKTANASERKIYLTTTNQDNDNYIGKILDNIINEHNNSNNNNKNNLSNIIIDTYNDTKVEVINDSILIEGMCSIKINCK